MRKKRVLADRLGNSYGQVCLGVGDDQQGALGPWCRLPIVGCRLPVCCLVVYCDCAQKCTTALHALRQAPPLDSPAANHPWTSDRTFGRMDISSVPSRVKWNKLRSMRQLFFRLSCIGAGGGS